MAENSVIGQSTQVRGNVHGRGAIEILGRVQGDVTTDSSVTLEEGSAVKGNISGTTLRVSGSVQGDLTASESLTLGETARVVGNLSAPRIGILEGALVRGKIQTGAETAAAPPARTTAVLRSEREPVRPAPVESRPRPTPAAPTKVESPPPVRRPAPAPTPQPKPSANKPAPPPARKPPPAPAPVSPRTEPRLGKRPPPPVVPILAQGARAKKRLRER
jgi:cytoskeletal protein CcmA (bactofilin family)